MPNLPLFQEWCRSHNIWLDPRLELQLDDLTGLKVVAREAIPPETIIVKIPKSALLSSKTSTTGRLGLLPEDDPQLNLAFSLLDEWLDGETSMWWGYLQTLPWEEPPPLALFWPDSVATSDFDGDEAMSIIEGSDLSRTLRSNGCVLNGSIARYFTAVVSPMLAYRHPRLESSKRYSLFKTAYALVSSRSFVVDVWHGPAMVPIADAFNHMEDYGVCMFTEFEVCRQCGAFSQCDHDTPPSSPVSADLGAKQEEDTADMVTSKPHGASDEIFNTYSHSKPLSNIRLLMQYGFIEEGNGADRVTFSLEEIESALGIPVASTPDLDALYIDSEGEPCPALGSALSNNKHSRRHQVTPPSNPVQEEIVAHDGDSRLSQLCIARLQRLYAQGNVETLATAIDSVPPSRPKTALAYRYLMNEALLLRACLERAHD